MLLRDLLDLGYSPVTEVAGRGEFARRGGIVDIFPPSLDLPIRVESFGDEIDSLRAFDPTDQRTVARIERAVLLPASEFLLPTTGVAAIRERLGKGAARLGERLAADLARFEGTTDDPLRPEQASRALAVGDAAEIWAPILAPATGLDHIAEGTLLILDEPGDIAEAAASLWRQADERRDELTTGGDLPRDWPDTYLPTKTWKARLAASRTLELTWESEAPRDVALAAGMRSSGDPFGWREPTLPPGRTARLGEAVTTWLEDDARLVIASDQAPRLSDVLDEAGHAVAVVERIGEAPPPGAIALVGRSLNGGFVGGPDGLAFVTDRELFGTVRVRRPKALRRVVPRDILERLDEGDLVVHIDHGVARYERMLRRGPEGEERDYLELSFNGGDRIFVPVEQIARVTRYAGGERPQLSKLGGTEWLRAKQRVRKAVADLADDLLALYASRARAQGHAFGDDTPWQQELEASFPYEETVDQLRAAAEVKADMELGRPMDRLVVGDVGYGKTEVALRAAFKATQDDKQVAVLVPTTVLAAQHHTTFSQRFAAFPLEVRLLSRFVSAKEQAATLAGLKDGTVDLVIGTHRLLSKDVEFRDLGLVVVDEEQRFGVAAKERLKQLRQEVDVLTLSAHAHPAHAQPGHGRHPRPERHRDAAGGPPAHPDPRRRGPRRARPRRHLARAGPRRPGLLRPQPGRDHRGPGRAAPPAAARRALRGRARPDGRGRAGEGHDRLRPGPGGRPGVHDHHRVGPRHPQRQHHRHRSRGHARAGPAVPAPRAGRPLGAPGLRLPAVPPPRAAQRRGPQAAAGHLQRLRARRGLPDRPVRPGDPRRRQHPGWRAVRATWPPSASTCTRGCWPRRSRRRRPSARAARRASRRPRRSWTCRSMPTCPTTTWPTRPRSSSSTGAWPGPGRVATSRPSARSWPIASGRCRPPVLRLVEVAELRLAAEAAGIGSIAREGGWLIVRFGAALTRASVMGLLGDGGLPGVKPSDTVIGANQVRVRAPASPARAWQLTQAIVARLASAIPEPRRRPSGTGDAAPRRRRHRLRPGSPIGSGPRPDRR